MTWERTIVGDADDAIGDVPCPFTNVRGLAGGSPGLVAVGHTRIEDDEGRLLGYRSVVWLAPAVEN